MAQLLTREEAAAILQITPRVVDALRRRGELPCVKLTAKAIRFDPDALNEYIKTRSVASTPPVEAA